MILRGPQMSVHAVHVEVERRRQASVPVMEPTAAAPSAGQPPAQPQLTAERVKSWIAQQGADPRREVAAALATEIEAEYEAARSRGRDDGRAEARAEAAAEHAAQLETLARLASELEAAFSRDTAALAEQCAEIVMEALRKIGGPALASRDGVVGAVIEVLRRLEDGREVVVRVCAADLETLAAAQDTLSQALGGTAVTLAADRRVELGGCIVESQVGSLDGRLEVQLQELCETLRLAKEEGRKR